MPYARQQKKENSKEKPQADELVSIKEAAEISGLTPRHLRYLVNQGTIWGKKLGRDWFTTAQVVREYIARDRRPGPKSKKIS